MTALGVEYGTKYTLTGPDGTQAVFNDDTSPNFVGILSPESSGLDSPDVREDAADVVEGDGGIHGDFYFGRRPVVLQGTILASSPTQRNERIERLTLASRALRGDASLLFQPAGAAEAVSLTTLRRQQPLRITKGYVKDFQLPLVAADPRFYGASQGITKTYTQPEEFIEVQKPTAGTIENSGGPGSIVWSNVNNIKVSDGVYATAGPGVGTTVFIKPQNYGFAIPAGAVITGIQAQITRKVEGGTAVDNQVSLIKAGTVQSKNKKSETTWNTFSTLTAFGSGKSDLWETTWTPADINSTGFGVALNVALGAGAIAQVDFIRIIVFYSVGTETHAQAVVVGGNAPTPPTITAYGNVLTSGIKVTNSTTGFTFNTSSKPLAGQNLLMNFANKTSQLFSTGIDEYYKIAFDPNSWWELQPGTNNLILPPSSKVEVFWRNAWM